MSRPDTQQAALKHQKESSQILKGVAVEVPGEHDDSQAPGQPALTWREIDMPYRANGNWSQAKQRTLQCSRGVAVLTCCLVCPPPPFEAKPRLLLTEVLLVLKHCHAVLPCPALTPDRQP